MRDLIRKSIGDTNQFLFLTRLQNAIFNQTTAIRQIKTILFWK